MADRPDIEPPSRSNRRNSWARAFYRVRDAMKRRRSSSAALPAGQSSQEITPTAVDRIDLNNSTTQVAQETPTANTSIAPPAEPSSSTPVIAAPIEADDVQDHAPEDESQSPVYFAQSNLSDERAHDIFARYDLTYQPRGKQPQREIPAKVRRVEKPVRIRVHWTCHACRTEFGVERVCAECGHRRCRSCERHPPRRLKNADLNRLSVEERAEAQNQESTTEEEPANETLDTPLAEPEVAASDPDLEAYREEPAASPLSANRTPPREASTAPAPVSTTITDESASLRQLEVDDDAGEDYQNLRSTQLTIYTRPRAAVQTMMVRPTKRPARRTCHECNSAMMGNRSDCLHCGHIKCAECTTSSERSATQEDEPPMFKGVKRVYRKPRQRVRYKCEHCNTQMESDTCAQCGHQRCETCHREPPRRQPRAHDAELLAAVAERLAGYGHGSNLAGPSTATAAV